MDLSLGDFQVVKDIAGIGVKDLMSIYGQINQANIDKGFANTQNYAAELKAQEGLLRLRTQIAETDAASAAAALAATKPNYATYALIAAVLGVVVYMAVK